MNYFDIKKDAPVIDFKLRLKKCSMLLARANTVLATFVHFFNKDYSIIESIKYANKAAGIAIAHAGCYLAKEKEILKD